MVNIKDRSLFFYIVLYILLPATAYSRTSSLETTAIQTISAPSTLSATAASSSQINLSWLDNSGIETGYKIERAPDVSGSPGSFAQIGTAPASATAFSSTGLNDCTKYWYRVRAYNAEGDSAYSNNASDTTESRVISAPSTLSATAASSSQINLSWLDNSGIETGFKIERAPDVSGSPGSFAQIGTAPANATAFSSTGLNDCTKYWYRVRAYNACTDSAYSNNASDTTESRVISAPSTLSATAASSSQINLSWLDNSGIETGFKIERAPDVSGSPGSFAQIGTAPANATAFSSTGLSASTKYWYRVRAYNACTDSAYSNNASDTTLEPTTITTIRPTTTTTVQSMTSSSTSSSIPTNTTKVTLGWDKNTEPDIAGYKIYYGNSSRKYTNIINVKDKTATSCTITNLTVGQTYYFAATSYNKSLVESNYSAEVSWPFTPATTSVPETDGGGGYHPSTSTTTITVTTSTTPSAPPPECFADDDCDDKVFCNGTEECINGTCLNGQNPCGEEQVCREELQQCRDVVSITADSLLRKVVMRPILLDKKCLWLIVYPSQDHHFMPESSSIEITGPEAGAHGVIIDSRQSAVSVGRFIFVPVCIEQGATTGQWNLLIKTDVGDSAFEESIIVSLEVR